MPKGRPQKYSRPLNIVQTGIKNNHRLGDCLKCGKTRIKSSLWYRHIHDDWNDVLAEKRNNKFVEKLILTCHCIIKE